MCLPQVWFIIQLSILETNRILLWNFFSPLPPQKVSSLDKEKCLEAAEEMGTPVKSEQVSQGRKNSDLFYSQNTESEICKFSLTLKYLKLEIWRV